MKNCTLGHAHGKVILLGEHAVVYGHPALVAAIERGATAEAQLTRGPSVLRLSDHQAEAGEGELGRALAALLDGLDAPPVSVSVELHIPAGCGLGASAAMGVAVARAVMAIRQEPHTIEDSRLLLAAQRWERVFHGNPSGIDAAASVYGGCLSFTRSEGPRPLSIENALILVVGLAAPPASTKVMVERLSTFRTEQPEFVDARLTAIAQLVDTARPALSQGDPFVLGPLLDQNQSILGELGVSSLAIDEACTMARCSGALGAKLTGAGGGGCVVALCSNEPDALRVLETWQKHKIPAFVARVGGPPRSHEQPSSSQWER
jgi:mevalonate kinase